MFRSLRRRFTRRPARPTMSATLATLIADPTLASDTRRLTNALKITLGCEICGYRRRACALQFDHIDPATKYRTRNGKVVHPSDMIKGGRYALATVIVEIMKCRIVCANCHAEHTHDEQRKE